MPQFVSWVERKSTKYPTRKNDFQRTIPPESSENRVKPNIHRMQSETIKFSICLLFSDGTFSSIVGFRYNRIQERVIQKLNLLEN